MKSEEDEAFDELAKRQGHWGGGYQAKRQAAADKLQEPYDQTALDDIAKIPTLTHGLLVKLADVEAVINEALAQPAQEPDMLTIAYQSGYYDGKKATQREWNAALDEAAARIGEIKGFGQATQDSFAVFIQNLKR